MTDMIAETADRLFAAYADACLAAMPQSAEAGTTPWQADLWHAIEEAGFPLALLSEEEGGFGLTRAEAFGLVEKSARYAAAAPLAETMAANWLLAGAGLDLAEGPATFAAGASLTLEGDRWLLRASLARVPWGADAAVIAVLAEDESGNLHLARVAGDRHARRGHNIAAEARDDLTLELLLDKSAVSPAPINYEGMLALGAALRAQALAGALDAVLEKSVAYANERVQFGRPIGRFQAIQQNLAVMAGQVAAARAAAQMAADAHSHARTAPEAFRLAAAAAKLRAGEAAGIVAAIAHQVHGAIGFTQEYPLHPLTRRLWAWREEFGSETHWAEVLGGVATAIGADAFWPFLTHAEGVPQ